MKLPTTFPCRSRSLPRYTVDTTGPSPAVALPASRVERLWCMCAVHRLSTTSLVTNRVWAVCVCWLRGQGAGCGVRNQSSARERPAHRSGAPRQLLAGAHLRGDGELGGAAGRPAAGTRVRRPPRRLSHRHRRSCPLRHRDRVAPLPLSGGASFPRELPAAGWESGRAGSTWWWKWARRRSRSSSDSDAGARVAANIRCSGRGRCARAA